MKIFKQIIALVLICITCISLVGCYMPKNEELYSISTYYNMVASDIKVQVKSKNTIVPIGEDIDFDLTYWHENHLPNSPFYPFCRVSIVVVVCSFNEVDGSNNLIKRIIIREIEEFRDDKYFKENVEKEDSLYGKEFITIDNNWLFEQEGYIHFAAVNEEIVLGGGYEGVIDAPLSRSFGLKVYYVKRDENIILFGTKKDYQDYKKHNIFI